MSYLGIKYTIEKHIECTKEEIERGLIVACYHLGEILALLYEYAKEISKRAPSKWKKILLEKLIRHVEAKVADMKEPSILKHRCKEWSQYKQMEVLNILRDELNYLAIVDITLKEKGVNGLKRLGIL